MSNKELPQTPTQEKILLEFQNELRLIQSVLELNTQRPLSSNQHELAVNGENRTAELKDAVDSWSENRAFAISFVVNDIVRAIELNDLDVIVVKMKDLIELFSSEMFLDAEDLFDPLIEHCFNVINHPRTHRFQRKLAETLYHLIMTYREIKSNSQEPDYVFLTRGLVEMHKFFVNLEKETNRLSGVISYRRFLVYKLLEAGNDEGAQAFQVSIQNAEMGNFFPLLHFSLLDMYMSIVLGEKHADIFKEHVLEFIEGVCVVSSDSLYDSVIERTKASIADVIKRNIEVGFNIVAAHEIEGVLEQVFILDRLFRNTPEDQHETDAQILLLQDQLRQRIEKLCQLAVKHQNPARKVDRTIRQ